MNVSNRLRHFRTDDVHDANDADQNKTAGFDVLDLRTIVVVQPALTFLNILVAQTECPQCFRCELVDDVIDGALDHVGQRLNLAILVHVLVAHIKDDIRAALDENALVVTTLAGGVLNNRAHAFAC